MLGVISRLIACGVLLLVLPRVSAAQSAADVAAGKTLFGGLCVTCHGFDGAGGAGPSLNRPKLVNAPDDAALRTIISDGIPNRGMPRVRRTTESELRALVAYVRSLGRMARAPVEGQCETRTRALHQAQLRRRATSSRGRAAAWGRSSPRSARCAVRSTCVRRSSSPRPCCQPARCAFRGRGYNEYLPVRVVMKDGREVRGLRLNEDVFTIQLRDVGRAIPLDSQERRGAGQKGDRRQPDAELCRPHERRGARRSGGVSLESRRRTVRTLAHVPLDGCDRGHRCSAIASRRSRRCRISAC